MGARYQQLEKGVRDLTTGKEIKPDKSDQCWLEYQEALSAGEVPLPMDAVGALDLASAKAERILELNAHEAVMYNKVIRGISGGELATWCVQFIDALAVRTGTPNLFAEILPQLGQALGMQTTPASISDALGQHRGETEAELSSLVIGKALMFLVPFILINGACARHKKAIEAMTDVRDIIVYDWRVGWPVIE